MFDQQLERSRSFRLRYAYILTIKLHEMVCDVFLTNKWFMISNYFSKCLGERFNNNDDYATRWLSIMINVCI